jgi:hypothetical protein
MDLDQDCDGYVAAQDMIDALLLLPCQLTRHRAVEFVASLPNVDSDDIGLSSLWIALMCPDLEGQADGDEENGERGFFRASADSMHVGEGEGYQFYMPNLTQSQFHVEVLGMSRAAAERLSSVYGRLEQLQAAVDREDEAAHSADVRLNFGDLTKAHAEYEELSVALERARAATATEARRTQAAAKRLSMVHQQISHWAAYREAGTGALHLSNSPGDHHGAHAAEGRTRSPHLLKGYEGAFALTHPDEYSRVTSLRPPKQLTEDPRLTQVCTVPDLDDASAWCLGLFLSQCVCVCVCVCVLLLSCVCAYVY